MTQLFVCLFKKTIKNILANHITNEFIICDVRTLQILDKFEKQSTVYKLNCSRNNNVLYSKLQDLKNKLNKSIEDSKKKYYPRLSLKLLDPSSSLKAFWSILKTSLDNKKYHASYLFVIKISLSLILLEKKLQLLTLFSLSSAPK